MNGAILSLNYILCVLLVCYQYNAFAEDCGCEYKCDAACIDGACIGACSGPPPPQQPGCSTSTCDCCNTLGFCSSATPDKACTPNGNCSNYCNDLTSDDCKAIRACQ